MSSDGNHIAFANGKVLRSSDLFQLGEINGQGRYRFSVDGTTIYSGIRSFIDRHDPVTYQALERIAPSVNCEPARQLHSSADGRVLITAGQSSACFWMLDQPVTMAIKAKAHDSYICGPACMMRNHRLRSGVNMRVTPSRH